jgi:hypothetical protein
VNDDDDSLHEFCSNGSRVRATARSPPLI